MFKVKVLLIFLLLSTCVKPHDQGSVEQKFSQILNPSVLISFRGSVGTGVLINRQETKSGNSKIYRYTIITVSHIFQDRNILFPEINNGNKGKTCLVNTYKNGVKKIYIGTILKESVDLDLCLVGFITKDKIDDIATIADKTVLSRIKVFDNVYLVGCQAGFQPMVTSGVISLILAQKDGLLTDAEAYFGSSGGGMFKYDEGKYYLIGICKSIWTQNGDNLSHISFSSSVKYVSEFINK